MDKEVQPAADLFKEVMAADTKLYPFIAPTPYNPDLLASRKGGLEIYDKMRRDDAIKACLGLKKHAVLSSGWEIEPASDSGKDSEIADFIADNLKKMEGIFDDSIIEIMSAFDYGFSCTEKILKIDSWRNHKNRVMLKALKTRKPHGIDFRTDRFGNLLKIIQANTTEFRPEKFIIFVNNNEFNNWYGESDLRACYRSWWSKDNIIKFWNIWLERFGMPPIIGKIDQTGFKNASADSAKLQNILRRLQTATSVILPDNIKIEYAELKSGRGAESYKQAVEKHDMALARLLLVPNLLGLSQQMNTGSYSQSRTQYDVFLWIILKIRRTVEELINEKLIRELVDYNYTAEDYPMFKFLPLDDNMRMELAKLWVDAVSKGIVASDQDDRNLFRKILGWPQKEDEETPQLPGGIGPDDEGPDAPPEQKKSKDEPEEEWTPPELALTNPYEKKGGLKKKEFRTYRDLTEYEKRVDFVKINDGIEDYQNKLQDRVTDVLKKQKAHIQGFLRKKLEAKEVNVKLINSLQLKYLRELRQVLREGLREGFTFGRDTVLKELGKKKFAYIPPTQAIDWLDKKSFHIKGVFDEKVSRDVKEILLQSLEYGESVWETVEKVGRVYDKYIGSEAIQNVEAVMPWKTEMLVRNAFIDAFNNGRLAMGEEPALKDYIIGWQYSAIIDARTSVICQELDGMVFKKDDPALQRLKPKNHNYCRSILVPVTTDDVNVKFANHAEVEGAIQKLDEFYGGKVGDPALKKRPTQEQTAAKMAADMKKKIKDYLKVAKIDGVNVTTIVDKSGKYTELKINGSKDGKTIFESSSFVKDDKLGHGTYTVGKNYRGKGVGSAMVEATESAAWNYGAKSAELTAVLGSEGFWTRQGFNVTSTGPTGSTMTKKLGKPITKPAAPKSVSEMTSYQKTKFMKDNGILRSDTESYENFDKRFKKFEKKFIDKNKTETWDKSLTPEEAAAINKYIGDGYLRVNNYLRGKSTIKPEGNLIENINSAIGKFKLAEDIVVYRINSSNMTRKLMGMKDGTYFTDSGFVSTSLRTQHLGWITCCEILLPRGAKAAYVKSFSGLPREYEVIIGNGTTFKILGRRIVGKMTVIQMEAIPPS